MKAAITRRISCAALCISITEENAILNDVTDPGFQQTFNLHILQNVQYCFVLFFSYGRVQCTPINIFTYDSDIFQTFSSVGQSLYMYV